MQELLMLSAAVTEPTRLPFAPLLVLGGAAFCTVVTELLPAGLLTAISSDFAVSESTAGLLTAVYAGIIVLSVVPLMKLTAHMSRRRVMVIVLLLVTLSNALFVVSNVFAIALASRLIGGAAHGMLWALLLPYASRLVPAHRSAAGVAVVSATSTFAIVAGVPLGTLIGTAFGWRVAVASAGVISFALIALVLTILPAVAEDESKHGSLREAVRSPGVLTVVLAIPLFFMGHISLVTYIDPFFTDIGATKSQLSLALSAIGLSGIFGAWIAGRSRHSQLLRLLPVPLSVLAVTFVVITLVSPSPTTGLLATVPWGVAFSLSMVYFQTASMQAAKSHKDAVSSMISMTTQAGIAAGAVYGGFALDTFGVRALPLAAAAPIALCIVIVITSRNRAFNP